MSSLTPEQLARAREMYEMFDTNKDNKMSSVELGNCIRACGFNPFKKEVDAFMTRFDADGSGHLSLDEFLGVLDELNQMQQNVKAELTKSLKTFDVNDDGFMDSTELKKILETMRGDVSDETIVEISGMADKDGDGKVSIEELATFLLGY